MKNYVAGFCFDSTGQSVALIFKNKPDWQKGLYNAIGGSIEENETPEDAMVREFREEAGVSSVADNWEEFLLLRDGYGKWNVHFFRCFNSDIIDQISDEYTTDEGVIEVFHIFDALDLALNNRTISNLKWMIPLAMDKNVIGNLFESRE